MPHHLRSEPMATTAEGEGDDDDATQQQQEEPPDNRSARKASVAIHAAAPTPTPTRPPRHRPSTSPLPHTSHAKLLQLHEYRERVQSACQSTYQFALQAPRTPGAAAEDERRRRAASGYCRSHVLATTRQFFRARDPSPSSSAATHAAPCATTKAHVSFHQMTARRDEFLFGDHTGSAPRRPRVAHGGDHAAGVAKDHFALGPGQYDVAGARPATAAKFSPSDRFHETFAAAPLGPGQYLASDALTAPRAAAAVFSQTPRRTEAALLVSPTAHAVSSYYFVPASSFVDRNAPPNDRPDWPRAPRLASQRRTTASRAALKLRAASSATDYVARNRTAMEQQRAVQRMRSAREQQGRLEPGHRRRRGDRDDDRDDVALDAARAPATRFKRRSSIFYDAVVDASPPQQQSEPPRVAVSRLQALVASAPRGSDQSVRGLVTLASLATFSVRLARTFHLATVLRRLAVAERQHVQRVVWAEWRQLDRQRSLQHATRVILANSFRLRVALRVRRKSAHVAILRQFLGGLSLDVQFAVAMKKVKRKILRIQRWWRHVQLMVRAREEALFHKWVSVETRLRLEYIGQMPHLQRIFQQPPPASSSSSSSSSAASLAASGAGASFCLPSSSSESDTTLHKLLNLPEQKRWFSAHFVLSSDGCLRGYSGGADAGRELVVEVKNFRCHFHDGVASGDFADAAPELSPASALQAYTGYSNARWKPFVMVFRPGAFRFVLLTSASPMPTEILAWKDRLERLALAPADPLRSPPPPTVGDFVEVSMQSGILAAHSFTSLAGLAVGAGGGSSSSESFAPSMLSVGGGAAASSRNVAAAAAQPPRGKLQARVRSIRQRNRVGLTVSEGELTYYVVDLLKDFPKVPAVLVWQTIRDKLREKRKSFRAELYRYNLELFHFHRHQEQTRRIRVLDKFKEFFTLERPKRPHFRSLVSNRKMELLVRQTVEQLRVAAPSTPRLLLDAPKASATC